MKDTIIKLGIVVVSVLISLITYSYLPETMASHWNITGQADGFSSKLSNLIAFPSIIVVMALLLNYIPKLDPKYKTIKKFLGDFNMFINILLLFFVTLQLQVILWNLGYKISMAVYMPIMLGLLFYSVGILLKKSKSNYSIGIRTPWTLASEKVWDKTHKLGANLFKYSLPLFVIASFFPNFSFAIVITYLIGITIFLFVYSYKEYKKEQK